MNARQSRTKLLLHAGRLLLEFNESTEAIHRALTATAKVLTDETCHVVVSYNGVAVSLGDEKPALGPVRELRYNAAIQSRVHEILARVRRGVLDVPEAVGGLADVEAHTPRHSRWTSALLLGAGASSLALLLGADLAASAVAGLATALGLLARQELGRAHAVLLALPLAAAFIGAAFGGLAIRLSWTRSPDLVLIVPALMLVPGPHLINALFDLIDNQLPMSLSRMGLAAGILFASALGVVLGIELTLPAPLVAEPAAAPDRLNLLSDMVLAGVATCGFAVFYNTPWQQLWMAVVGGMAGHGVRFLVLKAGCTLEAATFLGGLTVGAISAGMVRARNAPVAVIAFAGAVTMIPGLSLYRALAGALQLARNPGTADPGTVARTFENGLHGCLVVSALTLGLVVGARVVLALARDRDAPIGSHRGVVADGATRLVVAESSDQSDSAECVAENVLHDSGIGSD